jgi:hypothetical protein
MTFKDLLELIKVQRAVDGRVIVLITTIPSCGVLFLRLIIRFFAWLSMHNF